ncbi:unnamed protein product [Soboliphyme baturini]|uniref:Uncharacterized protein n=1 Tax=Soboliphyme baturini TaxID=241478 RepID=A0A183IWH4_9BILA|nr:unnamed protein product [Soboliphyme baturini]
MVSSPRRYPHSEAVLFRTMNSCASTFLDMDGHQFTRQSYYNCGRKNMPVDNSALDGKANDNCSCEPHFTWSTRHQLNLLVTCKYSRLRTLHRIELMWPRIGMIGFAVAVSYASDGKTNASSKPNRPTCVPHPKSAFSVLHPPSLARGVWTQLTLGTPLRKTMAFCVPPHLTQAFVADHLSVPINGRNPQACHLLHEEATFTSHTSAGLTKTRLLIDYSL